MRYSLRQPGDIADNTLLGVAYRVLFIRRYSLPVAYLHDVIHYDNLLGAANRVLFKRRYSLPVACLHDVKRRQPSRSSLLCPLH